MAYKANLVQGKVHQKRYENKSHDYKPKATNPSFKKKKGSCFVCGKPGHHAPQCRKRVRNDNPPKPKTNLVQGDDIIAAVISQVNMVTNTKDWVVDFGDTRHICANRDVFTSYASVGNGEEVVYLGDS